MPSLSELMLDTAERRGFILPEPIEGSSALPEDVTVISGRELMRLMTTFTGLLAYASSEEAIASAKAKAMAARYKQARAQRYIERKDDADAAGMKLTEKRLEYELDAEEALNDYRKEELVAENYARLVRAILSGYEAKYGLLSRELTRRSQDHEREDR